jgi:phenylglyoxylate dehydrogenase beta subunit
MYNDCLVASQNNCPPDCTACIEACRKNRKDGSKAGITKMDCPEVDFHNILFCNQCSQPECSSVCPTGALSRSSEAGVVRLENVRCIGCGLCTLACAYGGVSLDTETRKAFKCDLCGGDPACSKACPSGILQNKRAGSLTTQLGEDLLSPGLPFCAGCLMELFCRFTLKILGKEVILFGAPSCSILSGKSNVAFYGSLMTNGAASMCGVRRYYSHIQEEVICVGMFGDGATADIGFQGLSSAAERGEKILYICYDNEAYMNTGIQQSGTTPQSTWTTTTQVGTVDKGKRNTPKNIPLLMAMHEITYTATANLAYLEDYASKLKKAEEAVKEGMAYIHVLTPCPTGWRSSTEEALQVSRVAVETNYFPLWEAEYGQIRLTHMEPYPKPIQEFTKLMGRFAHLSAEGINDLQVQVDQKYNLIKGLTKIR